MYLAFDEVVDFTPPPPSIPPPKIAGSPLDSCLAPFVCVDGVFFQRVPNLFLTETEPEREQIHCVDPTSGNTLYVATGLPIMLTRLAILPHREHHEGQRMDVFENNSSNSSRAASVLFLFFFVTKLQPTVQDIQFYTGRTFLGRYRQQGFPF